MRVAKRHLAPMESEIRSMRSSSCFLCEPESALTWMGSESFRAVLGLGPVGEGFTLIATREHLPSMFDLDSELEEELVEFTAEVRARLRPLYGSAVVAEHGRVAPCVGPMIRQHEPHCLHAHRLVFPGHDLLDLRRAAPRLSTARFDSYPSARRAFAWPGQYIYAEQPDGSCEVGAVSGPLPRQFLRAVVASAQGRPELADWRLRPDHETVEAARLALARQLVA
jgi:diadenosine tetraphosphate (Ap4A) HIT family hydrolase